MTTHTTPGDEAVRDFLRSQTPGCNIEVMGLNLVAALRAAYERIDVLELERDAARAEVERMGKWKSHRERIERLERAVGEMSKFILTSAGYPRGGIGLSGAIGEIARELADKQERGTNE